MKLETVLMSGHAALADPKLVPKVCGPHPHAPYRANTKQISDLVFLPVQAADV